MNKTLMVLLALLISTVSIGADNLLCTGGSCQLRDNVGRMWRAQAAFTTNGSGDIFTLGNVASSDNIIGLPNSGNRTLIDNLGRSWDASVFYTTDGSGNVIPVSGGGGGGVTSVSGTAPVVSSGGATPAISMHVADSTHDGYLSQGDWSAFNGKQAAGSYITALTSDVSASGPGSATATVNSVGASSAANIHSAELAANAATDAATASTLMKRDASGDFKARVGKFQTDQIQIGTADAFIRNQIWNFMPSAILRTGALGQDGDATSVASEGAVFYGTNSAGNFNNAIGDFAYARIKSTRLGIYNSIANAAGYIFRADETGFYATDDSFVKTFQVNRTNGLTSITNNTNSTGHSLTVTTDASGSFGNGRGIAIAGNPGGGGWITRTDGGTDNSWIEVLGGKDESSGGVLYINGNNSTAGDAGGIQAVMGKAGATFDVFKSDVTTVLLQTKDDGNTSVLGGVQVLSTGAQPTCDSAHRGLMWNVQGGTGVADILQVCQKTVADTYVWVTH